MALWLVRCARHGEYEARFLDEGRIYLWDRDDLIGQLLAHYDQLGDDLRTELPLKRIWTAAVADTDQVG